ncbi:MAG: hypothetical protein WC640_02045, partial [Candidatus Paceibacterota bacterium]
AFGGAIFVCGSEQGNCLPCVWEPNSGAMFLYQQKLASWCPDKPERRRGFSRGRFPQFCLLWTFCKWCSILEEYLYPKRWRTSLTQRRTVSMAAIVLAVEGFTQLLEAMWGAEGDTEITLWGDKGVVTGTFYNGDTLPVNEDGRGDDPDIDPIQIHVIKLLRDGKSFVAKTDSGDLMQWELRRATA